MANFNFNKVILGGRLTADPELRQTQGGIAVASFSIAVNRRKAADGSQPTDFFNCVAWRTTAEHIAKFYRKASSICVVGTIQNRSWVDKDNQKRYATDIVVDDVFFVDSAAESNRTQGNSFAPYNPNEAYGEAPAFANQPNQAPKFEDLSNDDDLPF